MKALKETKLMWDIPNAFRSLDELEGVVTEYPIFDSGLARSVFRARTRKLGELTSNEIRVGLDHREGLAFLIPLALHALTEDVMNDGGLYEGALMGSVLRLPEGIWDDEAVLTRVCGLFDRFLEELVKVAPKELKHGFPAVMGAYDVFAMQNMSRLIKLKLL